MRKSVLFCIGILIGFTLSLFGQDQPVEDAVPTTEQKEVSVIPAINQEIDYSAFEEYDEKLFNFGLNSPYQSVMSHLFYLQENKHYYPDSAALTFAAKSSEDLDVQELAIMLKEYLDGRGYIIYPEDLPRDENYIDTTLKKGQHVYFPVPGEKDIYLVKGGDRWLYSKHTILKLPELHNSLYPFGKLRWIPEWGHEPMVGLEVWQWLGIFAFILFSYILHRIFLLLLGFLLDKGLHRLFQGAHARKLYRKSSRPLSLLLITFLLMALVPMLQLPVVAGKYVLLMFKIARPVFAVLIVYYAVDLMGAVLRKRAEKTPSTMDDQIIPLLVKIAKGIVVVIGFVLVLENLDVNITTLLAGLSLGGLALALAAQDTVKNFFGSLMIFLDKPFQVGDYVVAGGLEGTVEEVSIRSTRIRTPLNSLIYIPNAQLADNPIDNLGMRRMRRFRALIGLTYDTPPELIEAFIDGLRGIAENHPLIAKNNIDIYFHEMANFSLNIMFNVYFEVPDLSKEWKARHQTLLAIVRLAQKLGVNFAFPTQTLQVETFPGKEPLSPNYIGTPEEYDVKIADFLKEWGKKMNPADFTD